ncbi:kelch repeat-containing protein [Archangium sp.]|uniref:kelch repeat-containing protein n=1 Tax=Archangium sp. TaxID=1872627 RepID=UPI00286C7476|nr:kelch repeat-containing protein [Archangium sp.]
MNRLTERLPLLLLPLLFLACADDASWHKALATETLVARAHDAFPELTETDHGPLPEHVALRVEPPTTEGGAMKLVTRGSTFLVQPRGAAEGPTALRSGGKVSYGNRHLLSAGGKQREVDGAWLAHQAQDFLLLDGGRVHRARYEVSLPESVVALRDAGEVLDFLDASGQPVLRFHYPVARDAAGRSFPAEVRLLGAVSKPSRVEGQLAVTSRLLTMEVVMDLGDVQGQATVVYVWSSTASMPGGRADHLMARLPGGKALAFGGFSRSGNQTSNLSSAVVYDAAAMTWSFTGAMSTVRRNAAAVELPDGRVLVTGGSGASGSALATAELYDPASGTWSPASSMAQGRYSHTATLLENGRVLVVGGWGSTSDVAGAELYDPATNTWTATTGSPSIARSSHTATRLKDGTVLVAGGFSGSTTLGAAELYDPATGTWSPQASTSERGNHTANLLEDGRVLLAGGNTISGTYLNTSVLFDPNTKTWSTTGFLAETRSEHAAVRLPNGRVVVVSGTTGSAKTEEYNPTTGTWSSSGSLTTGVGSARAALLLDTGNVLVTGGNFGPGTLSSAELYGPVELGWELTGSLSDRAEYTLTLLPDGRAVAIGGRVGSFGYTALPVVEAYNPDTGTWRGLMPLPEGRFGHSATLLADGRILVAGGSLGSGTVATARLYDPSSNSWSTTGSLNQARASHSATLLKDGRVLIAGGGGVSSAELYDPATGTFQLTGALGSSRFSHVAVRLEDGQVLLAGGYGSNPLATAELYDPAMGTFQATGSLSVPRNDLSGALLRNGKVLVTGGYSVSGTTRLTTAELYDPVTRTFAPTGSMTMARSGHRVIALETGNVVVVGGTTSGGSATASTELYELATGTFRPLRRMLHARANLVSVLLRTGKVLVAGGGSGSAELGPLNSAPVASSASVTTKEDEQVAVTLSGTDGDSEPLEYELVRAPAHGTLSGQAPELTYVPTANYSGSDSFTFRVADAMQRSAEATVSVTVTAVNDAPVVRPAQVMTVEDTAVAVALSGTDAEGDPLTYTVVTSPSHGTLSGTPPNLLYTPAANASGTYTLTFRANDGQESSAEATVSISVTAVNDAPVARPAAVTTKQGSAAQVTLAATDVEWGTLAYTVVTGPAHGTLSGTPPQLTYTPEPGFAGEDSFTFTARDEQGAQSNEATVSLTVTPRKGGGGGLGCTAMGSEWPLGGLALLLLGVRRRRGAYWKV